MEGELICLASRDWEDSGWQFLSDRVPARRDVMIVGLKEVYRVDPSIAEIAELPPGWMASRTDRSSPWKRERNHPFPVFIDDQFYLDYATSYERCHPDLYRIPSQQMRENLKVGDTVKLIFRFADEASPRQDNECERMWVTVTEVDPENCRYRGTLDNNPLLHSQIALGHDIWFHPLHVFDVSDSIPRPSRSTDPETPGHPPTPEARTEDPPSPRAGPPRVYPFSASPQGIWHKL